MLNKNELVGRLAEELGASKAESGRVLDAVIKTLSDALVGGEAVKIPGFGIFSVKDQPARERRNPSTGETFMAAASKKVVFKPSSDLKGRV